MTDTTLIIESSRLSQYSDTFNDPTAEITYQSCDNVRFRIHIIYLKAHSGILAPPEGASLREVVHLTEPASVLELLFKFICPIIQPVLALEVTFEVLRDLAEAAEKYQVFPAMYACHLEMQATLPNHAIFVLGYALKHGYADLVDEAAPYTIEATFPDIVQGLPSEFHESWSNYYQMWLNVRKRALCVHPQTHDIQADCAKLAMWASELSLYRSYKVDFASQDSRWLSAVKTDMDAIPKMSTMAGSHRESRENLDGRPTGTNVIIIQSCKGTQHYANLDIVLSCSKGLAGSQKIVNVPENSRTIGLLLQYLKPAQTPNLTELPYKELRDLALAAEKYSIYPAMGSCRVMLKRYLPEQAKDVFYYALKSRYLDLLDLSAPHVLAKTGLFLESTRRLPEPLILPWARYSQKWRDFTRDVIRVVNSAAEEWDPQTSYSGHRCNCSGSFADVHVLPVLSALVEGSEPLVNNIDALFPYCDPVPAEETYCVSVLAEETYCDSGNQFYISCKRRVQDLEQVPLFSSLM